MPPSTTRLAMPPTTTRLVPPRRLHAPRRRLRLQRQRTCQNRHRASEPRLRHTRRSTRRCANSQPRRLRRRPLRPQQSRHAQRPCLRAGPPRPSDALRSPTGFHRTLRDGSRRRSPSRPQGRPPSRRAHTAPALQPTPLEAKAVRKLSRPGCVRGVSVAPRRRRLARTQVARVAPSLRQVGKFALI